MAWGYWSATAVDRGRSPRRNTQCQSMPINMVPQSEPPAPTCYSPCRSRCSSPCHSPCSESPCPCPDSPPPPPLMQSCQGNDEYSRRPSIERLDSPQVILSSSNIEISLAEIQNPLANE